MHQGTYRTFRGGCGRSPIEVAQKPIDSGVEKLGVGRTETAALHVNERLQDAAPQPSSHHCRHSCTHAMSVRRPLGHPPGDWEPGRDKSSCCGLEEGWDN
jgi:hypothetical protein